MAAALLKVAIAKNKFLRDKVFVDSAGLSAYEEFSISNEALELLKAEDSIDLRAHKSKFLTREMVKDSFVILAMTRAHIKQLNKNFSNLPEHVYLFKHFCSYTKKDVSDPIGGGIKFYKKVKKELESAIPLLIKHIERLIVKENEQ